jgi:peptidoglycan/LPS O-acetylase OafA/YrhL
VNVPAGATPYARGRRIPALDGFRAVAAILILLDHAQHDVFPSALIGVDIFFVLSGFLITGVILNERERSGRVSLRRFYLRRALRLYPALVLLVLISNLVFQVPIRAYLASAARALTYTTNVHLGLGGGSGALDQTWSLGVEEQFYLLWPIVLVLALRADRALRTAIYVFLGAVILHTITVILWTPAAAYMLPSSRLDQIIAGAMLALVFRTSRGTVAVERWCTPLLAWASVIAIGLIALLPDHRGGFYELARMWVVTSAAVGVIGHLASRRHGLLVSLAAARPAVWLGERSYGLYLLHILVITEIATYIQWRPVLRLPLIVGASVAAAAACYTLVERPFLRLKDRIGNAR